MRYRLWTEATRSPISVIRNASTTKATNTVVIVAFIVMAFLITLVSDLVASVHSP